MSRCAGHGCRSLGARSIQYPPFTRDKGVVMSPLIRLSLRLGSVVILAVILLFSVGIWAATQLQQDLLPNISIPSFVASTAEPGASPGVVDQQVTLPVVNALQGVAGVTSVDSTSSSGASIVTVQFKDGQDLTAARQAMSTHLDPASTALAPHCPHRCSRPRSKLFRPAASRCFNMPRTRTSRSPTWRPSYGRSRSRSSPALAVSRPST